MQSPNDSFSKTNGPAPTAAPGAVDIWAAPGFGALQLHRGHGVTQTYPRHWHDELYLGAILRGNGSLEYRGSSYATPRGTLMVVPPSEIHANRKENCSFRCMFIDCKELQTIVENFAEQAISSISLRGGPIESAPMLARFVEIHRLLESPDSMPSSDFAVPHFLLDLVTQIGDRGVPFSSRAGQERVAVLRAQKFLDENYAERVTLRELSQLARLSPFHLNRAFCRQVGIPPHAYQIQVRISRAKSLLRTGRGISETALSLGFVDQAHFSHQFRKFVGVTPGRYIR